MKNLLIKEQRDYTKGITELEFSLMKEQFEDMMFRGVNGVDCADQPASEMIWEIEDIYEETYEDCDEPEHFYNIEGYVVHLGEHSQKLQITKFYGCFNDERGLFNLCVLPAGEVGNRLHS